MVIPDASPTDQFEDFRLKLEENERKMRDYEDIIAENRQQIASLAQRLRQALDNHEKSRVWTT